MSVSSLPSTSGELWFNVDFGPYVEGRYNPDFTGKGTLVIRETEPRFVFTGHPRGKAFPNKETVELAIASDQIWNVSAEGDAVQFSTRAGQSGEKKKPFVFTCASSDEAETVAAALPKTKDAERIAEEAFIAQIRQLPRHQGLSSVTNLVLAANVAAFVLMGLRGAGWIQVASMKPYVLYGANNAAVTPDGQWWRLITCMFLHYGVIHLALNMWALFQVGHLVERLFGRPLYTLVYFGGGIIGSLATLLWNGPRIWSAGASGAVFGVYGALLGYLLREKHGVPAGVFRPLLQSALAFAGYNLVFGAVQPNIDNAAHVGGFAGGAMLGWLCALPPDRDTRARLRLGRGLTGLVVACVVIFIGALAAARRFHS